MYETPEHYLEIVAAEVLKLEDRCRCSIVDGTVGFCPRCGEYGTWDLGRIGFGRNYGNSIYYSTVAYDWRCRLCDFRRCR